MGCKGLLQVNAIFALCFELYVGLHIQPDRRLHVGPGTLSQLLHSMHSVLSCAGAEAKARGCILQDLLVLL